jgi:UPF0755 protein
MKLLIRLVCLLLLAAIVISGIVLWVGCQLFMPPNPTARARSVDFEVASGASGVEIAHSLSQQGLIHYELPFRLLMHYEPHSSELKAGIFRLSSNDSPIEILHHLMRDQPLSRRATIAEGLVAPQIAQALVSAGVLQSSEAFLAIVHGQGKKFGEIFPDDLEGYLYPETYDFPWKCTPEAAITRMTALFRAKVLPEWEKRRAKSPLKSLREVMILASMVEREAQRNSERGIIAGVYINRLRQSMPLQCDATVQFALGKQHAVVSYNDLKIDSPYNTYLHSGLPPGPISNPGLPCILAAMNPTPSSYLFYVRDDKKNDGSHVFSKTYAEHLKLSGAVQK